MKKFFIAILLFTEFLFSQSISRIPGSPYPVSEKPDTLFKVYDKHLSKSELLTVGTLQGILAQTKPKIFRISSNEYEMWLDDLENNYGTVVNSDYMYNFDGLIEHFKNDIDHYILCNLDDNSVSVAISLCGITNSIAVTGASKKIVEKYGITMLEDVRERDENWFFDNYGDQINKNILCFQKDTMPEFLADYASFGKMISLYNGEFTTWTEKIFNSFEPNSALFGWGFDEHGLVDEVSKYDIYVHAADFASNLSVLSNYEAEVKQKEPVKRVEPKENAHYVCFLMTDGDNIQWTLGGFASNPGWYGSSKRGLTNIGWTMSPAHAELAPTVLKYFYDNAANTEAGRDHFVAGPSGVGYMFPERYNDVESFASLTNSFMKKADLRILNLLGNNDADQYIEPFLEQDNIDAVFYYYYSSYVRGNGKIKWVNDKPVIYGRYQLWVPEFDDATELARKLNKASKDVYSSAAYSLVPVHVWSENVDDVLDCVSKLDSNVIVVTPDAFVALIKKNLGPRENIIEFIPNNGEIEKQYLVTEYPGSGSDSLHRWADSSDVIIYHFSKEEIQKLSDYPDELMMNISVSSEYVISASDSLNGDWTQVERWRATDTHVHGWNLTDVKISINDFFKNGWDDFYLKFEDGILSDGWGPKIFSITISKPKEITNIENDLDVTPTGYSLEPNYPNPFNPATTIQYSISNREFVELKVYNILGNEVSVLVKEEKADGKYNVKFDASKLASGVYFYRLQAGNYTKVCKMLYLK
ncbi:MAG: T9SS type A sorting domain-containing protein [Melioribacteraceae bacterium]|nr:T9SS type A sorting domain-containing protein [Melioribacteraceae bacterium]